MESHDHMYGAQEECHSCESGWTMYIGSPKHEDYHGDYYDGSNDDDDDDHRRRCRRHNHHANHDGCREDSDDSMASDASSGPSHQFGPRDVTTHVEHHHGHEEDNELCFDKKMKKPLMMKKKKQKEEEEEEIVFMEKRVKENSHSHSVTGSVKAMKSKWTSKRN